MADDLEHVRARYTGRDPLDVTNPHRALYNQRVTAGDVVEVPAAEVAAWPNGRNDLWEVVKADAPTVKKAAESGAKE